jgi:ABC-type lipoprotein release transport system permease subunit
MIRIEAAAPFARGSSGFLSLTCSVASCNLAQSMVGSEVFVASEAAEIGILRPQGAEEHVIKVAFAW